MFRERLLGVQKKSKHTLKIDMEEMFMDNFNGICGKHFKTEEEAVENLPQPVYQKKKHEMIFLKSIFDRNLYFCPAENRYYLESFEGFIECEAVYEAFSYKGKYLGKYSISSPYGAAVRPYETFYVVDYVPTEYMYDNLPADHFCNSVWREGYYYICEDVRTYPCSPAYLGFPFYKKDKGSNKRLDVTGLQKLLHRRSVDGTVF